MHLRQLSLFPALLPCQVLLLLARLGPKVWGQTGIPFKLAASQIGLGPAPLRNLGAAHPLANALQNTNPPTPTPDTPLHHTQQDSGREF